MIPGRYLSFEQVAADYDQTRVIPGPQLEEIARILAREAHLERGGLFLDAGVGTGRFAAPLAQRFPTQTIGVDIAPAMMRHVQTKAPSGSLSLAQADLQQMPFRHGVFAGALLVHILHLIEDWKVVLRELHRVLLPHSGILFLGGEQGSRSLLVDFYYQRARARQVLTPSLGTVGIAQTLAFLRRPERDGGAGAHVTLLETSNLVWQRTLPIAQTLDALERRTYSQMWDIPDEAHQELLLETRHYAAQTFPRSNAAEALRSRFALHKVWWP